MRRSIRLEGQISAVELSDGTLTVTIDGEEQMFRVSGTPSGISSTPRQPRKPRKQGTNGHAQTETQTQEDATAQEESLL